MTEYALIVGLVAILAIATVDKFGKTLQGTYAKSTNALGKVTAKVERAGKGGSSGGGGGGSSVGGGATVNGGAGAGDEDEERPGKPGKKPQN
jgi:Flp pilus assembly pilin Flp